MKPRIKPILINKDVTVKKAMTLIQAAPRHKIKDVPTGMALVIDKKHKLLGVVTDGDIRRAILKGMSIDEPVEKIMRKDPVITKRGASPTEMSKDVINQIEKREIANKTVNKVIIINESNKVHDVISFFDILKNTEIQSLNICVIGLGYVGLTLALTLADIGFKVVGVDSNKKIIDSLNKGEPHFHEVGLESLLKHHINKKFTVETDIKRAKSDVYIVAVNTPVENKKVIMTYLEGATKSLGAVLKPHDLVILRSTVPVGTCKNVCIPILEKESGLRAGEEFHLAFAPERTVEGKALEELKTLPQIIGGFNKTSLDLTTKLFDQLTKVIVPVANLEAAEMAKLLNNTFRDLSFAYANEIAQVCDAFNINSFEVINAANNGYPRNKIPLPSPGVGGACLTKDPYILADSSRKAGFEPRLPILGRDINIRMIDYVVSRVNKFLKNDNKKGNVFVMGMAFKGYPETSDLRFSTSVEIVNELSKKHNVKVYDSVVSSSALKKEGFNSISLEKGFKDADCVLVLNNHPSFRDIDVYKLLSTMNKPGLFFDGWNLFNESTINNVPCITYGTFGK